MTPVRGRMFAHFPGVDQGQFSAARKPSSNAYIGPQPGIRRHTGASHDQRFGTARAPRKIPSPIRTKTTGAAHGHGQPTVHLHPGHARHQGARSRLCARPAASARVRHHAGRHRLPGHGAGSGRHRPPGIVCRRGGAARRVGCRGRSRPGRHGGSRRGRRACPAASCPRPSGRCSGPGRIGRHDDRHGGDARCRWAWPR